MNYTKTIKDISLEILKLKNPGKVAAYIPELAKIDPSQFAVHLTDLNLEESYFGDYQTKFSIQSIAKVLLLTFAYRIQNAKLWKRVGVEPSGTPFNSLIQLEKNKGIPRNPMINAGALVISDILVSLFDDPKSEFINFVRSVSCIESIDYNERVAESEKLAGFTNAALINLMKSFGNIKNDIDTVIDFYCHICSIEMSCQELSKSFLFLVNYGIDPASKQQIVSRSMSKRINAIMQLCGIYDEAGEFSFKVGLPGKSGVGGGIVAIHPNQYSIAVWSPPLNPKGNSLLGMKFLEDFTTKTETSIF